MLWGRFVLAIKPTSGSGMKYKARFVVGGHRDRLKRLMTQTSQTIQPASNRLPLTVAAVLTIIV